MRASKLVVPLLLLVAVSSAAAERVVLPLTLNEVPKGDVVALVEGDDVMLKVADLTAAGVKGFAGRRDKKGGDEWVSLRSLAPELFFRLDVEAVTLAVTVPPGWLGTNVLDLGLLRPPGLVYASNTSLFVNYAVNVQDFQRWDGFGEAGFSLGEYLLYGAVSRTPIGGVVRGLMNITRDDRARLQRWVLGDTFASSDVVGGSLFLAGISVSKNFDLDPYFSRYPAFALSGAATTPSTVDVYVNGNIVRRQEIGPGTFQVTNMLLPTGSGATRVVIRDVFGEERTLTSGFYASTAVLAKGLSEYTYNLGFRRDDLSTASWDYGPLSFLGLHRYGFSDSVTGSFRFEADNHLVSGGPGFALRLPVGEVEGTLALSRYGDRNGAAGSLGFRYIGQPANYGLFVRALSPHYAALGLDPDRDRPRWDGSAFIGVQIGRLTSVTLQYAGTVPRDAPRTQRISLSTTTSLTRDLSLLVSFGRVFRGSSSGSEAFVGLSCFLGNMTTGLASYSHQDGQNSGSIDIQKSLPFGTGFGYRVGGTAGGGPDRASALAQYNAPFGHYEASVDRIGGQTFSLVSVSGGIVALGGTVLATRPVTDSFALIRVPGVAGVHGFASNQDVGTTNSSGNLLVPSVLPYYGNRIGIADVDVPMDYEIDATERLVATPYRGGAVVTFPVTKITNVTGRVVLEVAGRDQSAAYGEMTVTGPDGKAASSPVGADGRFYFENLPEGRYPAIVEHRETMCRFTLAVPASKSAFIDIGVVRCSVAPESSR